MNNMINRQALENFKYWSSYKIYLDLMKKFVDKKISAIKFSDQFFQRWKSDRDKISNSEELVYIMENLKLTEIDKLTEMDWFSSLISDLFLECESFEADPLLREDYDISKEELKNCVKKTLLEIKYRYS